MFTNEQILIVGSLIGSSLGIVAYLQSRIIWEKQGFAITRTVDERKIVTKYRKTSRSKIATWTQYFVYILMFIFILLTASGLINKLHVAILCFSFVVFFIIIFGVSAFFSDKIIRSR